MPRSKSEMFFPNVNREEMVRAALWNVDYHLGAVKHFNERPGMSSLWEDDPTVEDARKSHLQGEVNRFHAHLRAFFWELVATFEAMEVWAQETHGRKSRHLHELGKRAEADWYAEVLAYRNFSHRCFLLSQGEYEAKSGKLVGARSLISAKKYGPQPVIPGRLVEYRNEMYELFERMRRFVDS